MSPQTLSTSLTLTEIQAALARHAPQQSTRQPGWRSNDDTNSNLGVRDGVPPNSNPHVLPAVGDFPERLAARYYFWRWVQPENSPGQWVLDAVDVFVSKSGVDQYLALWSSLDDSLIDPSGGSATQALLNALWSIDTDADLSPLTALKFSSADVYLWLTKKMDEQVDIGLGVRVRSVSGIDADEGQKARTATLRGEVDMMRVAFLSAVAERSTFGPAVVALSQPNSKGRIERVVARLWIDGSFQLAMTPTYLRSLPDKGEQRLEAMQRFAYRYIPLVNRAFTGDKKWSKTERDWLVIGKRVELAKHYKSLARSHPRWAEYKKEHP